MKFKSFSSMASLAIYNHYRDTKRIIEVEKLNNSYLLTYYDNEGSRLQQTEDNDKINEIATQGIVLINISVEEMEAIVLYCPVKGSIFKIDRDFDRICISLSDRGSLYDTTITEEKLKDYLTSMAKSDSLTYEEWEEATKEEEIIYTLKDLETFLTTKLMPTFGEIIAIRSNPIMKYSRLQADLETIEKAIKLIEFVDTAYDEFLLHGFEMLDFFEINVVQGVSSHAIKIQPYSQRLTIAIGEEVGRDIDSTSLNDIVSYLLGLQGKIERAFDKFQTPITNTLILEVMKG